MPSNHYLVHLALGAGLASQNHPRDESGAQVLWRSAQYVDAGGVSSRVPEHPARVLPVLALFTSRFANLTWSETARVLACRACPPLGFRFMAQLLNGPQRAGPVRANPHGGSYFPTASSFAVREKRVSRMFAGASEPSRGAARAARRCGPPGEASGPPAPFSGLIRSRPAGRPFSDTPAVAHARPGETTFAQRKAPQREAPSSLLMRCRSAAAVRKAEFLWASGDTPAWAS